MPSLPVPVTTWYMVSPGSPHGSPTWSSGNTPSTLRALVASCCHQSQGRQTFLFALSVHPAPLQLIPHVRSPLGGGHWPDLTPDIFLLFAITPCITTAKSCSPYSTARAQTRDHRPQTKSMSEAFSLYKGNQHHGSTGMLLQFILALLTRSLGLGHGGHCGGKTTQAWGPPSTLAGSSRRADTDTQTLYNQEYYTQGQEGNAELQLAIGSH